MAAAKKKFDLVVKEVKTFELTFDEILSSSEAEHLQVINAELCEFKKSLTDTFLELENNDDAYAEYSETKSSILILLGKLRNKTNGDKSKDTEAVQVHSNTLKLPKFNLPEFYGDFNKWISFKEIFLSSIDQNTELSELQKYQYLLSAVKGSAQKIIAGFALSEANYKNAWQTLVSRYDNKRELAFAQISRLFTLKQLKSLTSKSILEILDTVNEVLRSLNTLGFEQNPMVDLMLIHFILSKVDDTLRERWELSLMDQNIPSFQDLVNFLERQAKSLSTKDSAFQADLKNKMPQKKYMVNNVVVKSEIKCPCIVCNEEHQIYKCQVFAKMSLEERWNVIKLHKLCANCLRKNHISSKCFSNSTCKSCHKKHHTLLHRFAPNSVNTNEVDNSNVWKQSGVNNSPQNVHVNAACYTNKSFESHTLLSTAIVRLKDSEGNFVSCRALIDNGSQKSLISKQCCERLKLPITETNHAITGINGTVVETALAEVPLIFKPHFNDLEFHTKALVVKKVTTDLPNFKFTSYNWPHLYGLNLADPTFAYTGPIDLLIGADLYAELIIGNPIHGERGSPAAISSHIGWLLSGRVFSEHKSVKCIVNCHATSDLNYQLNKFWELESVPHSDTMSKENKACEYFYESTVIRHNSGKYEVKLPFRSQIEFGDSALKAIKRFNYIENKLSKDENTKAEYSKFMREYLDLNHMELVPPEQINKGNSFYLPHHFVSKEDSTTTRLRVVFDGSAKDSFGNSLNDCLHIGPRLQPELFQLILKFRTYQIALTSDIEKMFRQIIVNKEDIDFQRIFWRFDQSDPIQVYRLLTVTYGLTSSPYLAVKTLQQLAKDEEINFPIASKILLNNFFMDDLLTGANSIFEAKQLVNDLNDLLKRGGFNLRKWASNCSEAIENIPETSKASHDDIKIKESNSQKILGLLWNYKLDIIQINIADLDGVRTKRQLLSAIARIFDPLGFLSPSTILLKIMMQNLWKNKLSWDEAVPKDILSTWFKFLNEINYLRDIQVPRYFMICDTDISKIQLHGFCDASSKAYSAVFYLRVFSRNQVFVSLVAAKTKVAPLKSVSLPRLELSAAVLLAKLYKAIEDSIGIIWSQVHLWSDSEITLCWIRSESLQDQFVRNRVSLIHSLTEIPSWNHISGATNPADCASRGIFPKRLKEHNLWWQGPHWLSDANSSFIQDADQNNIQRAYISESLTHSSTLEDTNQDFFNKYSSFTRLLRIVAWCKRFIFNSRNKGNELKGNIQVAELDEALITIIKQIQKVEFNAEIKAIELKREFPKNSKYISLSPFLDSDKVLRVGGRLKNSNLSSDAKYPILLPKNHHIVKIIIEYYHKLSLHAGTSVVLSLIRQKFWFSAGRDTVRKVLRGCIICLKINATTSTQVMGNLPRERVTPSRPFQRVGIDFAGPIATKPNVPRSRVTLKSYIALFICFATKAVHLELVSDLSTDAFLAAFRRFISRRGIPSDVFSDNATNFKGAKNYLNSLHELTNDTSVQDYFTSIHISWHFIPPLTPHFGGLWESNIKSVKRHLWKICAAAKLTYEELNTLLIQIESCLNSRPLHPLSSDPNDLESLTPGHFLIGTPLLSLPEKDPDKAMTLKSRWNLLQRLRSQFWSQWNKDYLHTLQTKAKWTVASSNVKVGDLVLLKPDSSPSPLKWILARILEVYPGEDGVIRVVKLKTSAGVFTRPVVKVCPLPVT